MIEFILSAPFLLSAFIIIAIGVAILLEFEKSGWATTLFSLGIALGLWAYKSEIWNFISSKPLSTLFFSLAYIATGIVWSLIKWKTYINHKTLTFNLLKAKFNSEVGEIKDNWKGWIKHLNSKLGSYFHDDHTPEQIIAKIMPIAIDKKALIVSWISYWPMSLAATLLNNPFKRFFEWIYSLISGLYDKMTKSATEKMLVGFEKEAKKDILKG